MKIDITINGTFDLFKVFSLIIRFANLLITVFAVKYLQCLLSAND